MMGFTADPIRITPRMLPRTWGKENVSAWCEGAPRPPGAIGEIWLAQANNMTAGGVHLGALVARAPQAALGEVGRAPPALRLVFTAEPNDPIRSESPLSLWRVLEAPLDSVVSLTDACGAEPRLLGCRRGDLFRVGEGAKLCFSAGVSALEARASFAPSNQPSDKRVQKLSGLHDLKHRCTWLRDGAMSVEAWTLPELSFLEPDGETCHLLTALTPGAQIDGHRLTRGETFFIPAEGRRLTLTGAGAQLVVSYPDVIPTNIWRHALPPKPAARAVHPSWLQPGGAEAMAHAASGLRAAA